MKKKIHPLAEIFPELSAAEFDKLKSSIDEHGQRETIVLLGDEILDGRNRYKACIELGRNPQFRNFAPARDGNPIQFVADRNLTRRHLTPSQRAGIAKKIEDALKEDEKARAEEAKKPAPKKDPDEVPPTPAEKKKAASETTEPSKGKTDDNAGNGSGDKRPHREREKQAAEAAGTSPRALRDFKFVEKWSPKDAKLVEKGDISMNEAKKRAKTKKDEASKFRNEAADLLAGSLDDEFAEKIRSREVLLSDSEIKAFSRLEVKSQRKIRSLIEEGWKVAPAVKFADGSFEEKDKIADLIAWFKAQDEASLEEGWGQIEVAGHLIAVAKSEKTEAEEDNG